MPDTIKIDIWSDIACPWCYLGKHRFQDALSKFSDQPDAPNVEVEYHSFQLSPEIPEGTTASNSEYLAAKTGWSPAQIAGMHQQIQELGEPYGLKYNFDSSKITNTHKAHQLLHLARENGRQEALKEALLQAYFSDGANIGNVDELADIAVKAGLDRTAVEEALRTRAYVGAVEDDKALAARHGIRGVPFFVLDGQYGVSGAQMPETFLEALNKAVSERDSNR